MGLCNRIVAWFLIGSLTGSLPTSYTLTLEGIVRVTCGRRSMRIYCGLSYTSSLKARSLRLTLA